MNRDTITLLFATALLVAVTATAGLCYWYLQCIRQHQQAQEEVARINRNKALIQTLVTESVEYAKKNPAIIPVLQRVGIRQRQDTNLNPRLEK